MKSYRLCLLLLAGIALLVPSVYTTPAAAQGAWAAIALSTRTGAWGTSYNYGDEDEARDRAMRECRKNASDCRVYKTFENVCVALAGDGSGNFGWAWGYETTSERRRRAVQQCRDQGGKGCEVVTTFCTGSAG
jgi:hypothetical protein